jgi:hypothetical protein
MLIASVAPLVLPYTLLFVSIGLQLILVLIQTILAAMLHQGLVIMCMASVLVGASAGAGYVIASHKITELNMSEAERLQKSYRRNILHQFSAYRKRGTMSVGIMSGIGDAVWSFVLKDAVRKKYGASNLKYCIHDSGDGRRKRSNNMVARFRFVDDLVSSKFQVHADKAMNDHTGHLNYLPSGPVRVSSTDEFDYRMIANTFLEHGQNFQQICNALGLDEKLLDYDFFQQYREDPSDLKAVARVTEYVGNRYAVFYFGAEVDNSIAGLNKDEMWSAEDWNKLAELVAEEFGLKIVVIGAPYDLSYATKVISRSRPGVYFNTIGQMDISETLSLIHRSQFIVAFPAGVGIVGPYMRVPTVIFWRPKHNSYHALHERAGFSPQFATNWVPDSALVDRTYYPAWYGKDTPSSILEVIRERGWSKRRVSNKVGQW